MDISLPKGGVVIGLGSDIVDVDRIEDIIKRQDQRFLDRVFTKEEQAYCFKMKNPHPNFAARFAAKEAVSKAFTTGIGEHLDWTSISVTKGERGQPLIKLDEKGKRLLDSVGGSNILISLSHTKLLAEAVAIIVA
tara:strand:- start:327 stop:731 length:405 start_codon:yes stop_codon:yes gene_type:complete